MRQHQPAWLLFAAITLAGCTANNTATSTADNSGATTDPGAARLAPPLEVTGPRWLAGDHHIHSRYSVGYDRAANPPTPILGQDAIYPIPMNALMSRHFGLSWAVATDHGGPNHSKINLDRAYPELLLSRQLLPDLVQFYGMELNSPGADHASLIMPHTHDESTHLHELESSFDKYETWPLDPARDQPGLMLEALKVMAQFEHAPVVIANHPARSAPGPGVYGLDDPAELRGWNNAAPGIAVGMAGAPGHQAAAISIRAIPRGGYAQSPTLGGFDQLTARLGGFWDSMLGEGRRWWITANSDSHVHHSEGGLDFWPGEYSKTWVFAEKNFGSILEALRAGNMFVATGDLITGMDFRVTAGSQTASLGGELKRPLPAKVTVHIRVQDPAGVNHHGENPAVSRIDLIMGEVTGPLADPATDTNRSTRVLARFLPTDWERSGEWLSLTHTVTLDQPVYFRIRGTSTDQLEPEPDAPIENPWHDLWFYSNPIFVSGERNPE